MGDQTQHHLDYNGFASTQVLDCGKSTESSNTTGRRRAVPRRSLAYEEYLRFNGLDPSCFEEPYRPLIHEGEISGHSSAAYIELDESILEDDLKCPICLGILDSTYTVMACLHRFCSECLHRSLRIELAPGKNNHECPSCRAKVYLIAID